MPLMVEPLAMKAGESGYGVDGNTETVVTLVRQAVELGADAIKADPTDDLEDYSRFLEIAGAGAAARSRRRTRDRRGDAAPDIRGDPARRERHRLRAQRHHERPAAMTRALMAVVHDGASADEALESLPLRSSREAAWLCGFLV
jgi:class I fructose-bisphosphate aldolase